MIKAIIRTALLVGAVLVGALFIPFIAAHQQALLIGAVAIGLIGVITRLVLILLLIAALVMFVYPLFT